MCTAYSQHSQRYVAAVAAKLCLHHVSICTSVQDASELWNHDAVQTAELFQELRLGQTNCLADNRQASWLNCRACLFGALPCTLKFLHYCLSPYVVES